MTNKKYSEDEVHQLFVDAQKSLAEEIAKEAKIPQKFNCCIDLNVPDVKQQELRKKVSAKLKDQS